MSRYLEVAFTENVQAAQEHYGARAVGERQIRRELEDQVFSWQETEFIRKRDSFYMATVSQTGWPYVQFRGGPEGFLKVLGPKTLAYADFRGNRQYLSVGNLRGDNRVSLFLVDYPNRRRLKILARASVHDASEKPGLIERLADPTYPAKIERAFVFELEAFDWNCPQHITPRFSEPQITAREAPLRARILELEEQLAQGTP